MIEKEENTMVEFAVATEDQFKKELIYVQADESSPNVTVTEMLKPSSLNGSQSPSNEGEESPKRSHTSSKLSMYLRHNAPSTSTHNIEPVLGSVTATDVELANQNANTKITIADGQGSEQRMNDEGSVSFSAKQNDQSSDMKNGIKIEGFSQSGPPSQLQQSSLAQLAKKSYDIQAESQPEARYLNQDMPTGLISPPEANQQQPPQIFSQHLVEKLQNQQDLQLVMRQLSPAMQQKIMSPPTELLMNSETAKLLELYQMQTLELMRMTEQASPLGGHHQMPMASMQTMEQAQQVTMPEIPRIGLNEFYETMRLPQSQGRMKLLAHESVPTVSHNGKGMQLIQGGKHPMLRIEQQSEVKPNGFMDFSGFSNRTISAPDIERYQIMDPSQSNPDCSYQKITMPAFYINNQTINTASGLPPEASKDGRKTGTFRDLKSHQSSKKDANRPSQNYKQPQVFLGMVDSEDNFRPRYEASPIKQQHLSLLPKPDKSQHWRMIKMPQPQKPLLIEKNFVGGGQNFSKYGGPSTKTARNNQMRSPLAFNTIGNNQHTQRSESLRQQPTFPAFFTRTAKNQQMNTTNQFERVITKTDAYMINTQMKEEEQPRKPMMKGNEGRQTQKDFMKHGSGLVVDPSFLMDKRKSIDNSGSLGKSGGGVTKTKGEILRYSVHVAPQLAELSQQYNRENNCRPILFQSSVLAPSIDETRKQVFIDKQSPTTARSPAATAAAFKTNLLNRPVFFQTSSTFLPSQETSQEILNQRGSIYTKDQTAAMKGQTPITHDSKLSFKEYVDQNYATIDGTKNLSSLGQLKDSILDTVEGSVSYNSRVPGHRIEARHSSLNNTLVPKLQAFKPKKLLDTATRKNFKSSSIEPNDQLNRMHRLTVMENPSKLADGRSDFAALKAIGLAPLDVPDQSYDAQREIKPGHFKAVRGPKTSTSVGMSISTTRAKARTNPSKDHKFEVKMKEKAQQQQQLDAIAEGQQTNNESQSTVRAGLKFNVDVAKRTSVHTLNQSNNVNTVDVNSNHQVTNTTNNTRNRDSAMSLKQFSNQQLATPSIITPKYFATIQPVKEQNASPMIRGGDKDELNLTLGLLSSTEDAGQLLENQVDLASQDALNAGTERNQLTISALTQPQHRGASKDLEHVTPELAPTEDQQTSYAVRTVGVPDLSFRQTGGPSDASNQSSWRRKKGKRNQRPPLMTAERIVQKNISPYERVAYRRNTEEDSVDDSPMVVGISKQLNEVWPSKSSHLRGQEHRTVNNSQKPTKDGSKTFLPDLAKRRISQTKKQSQVPNKIHSEGLETVLMENNAIIPIGGVTEEVDSILAPEFREIVGTNTSSQTLEQHKNIQTVEISSIPIDQSPRQERRQVIKILDQSRWRNQGISPMDQNDDDSGHNTTQVNPGTAYRGNNKSQTASTMEKKHDASVDQTIDQDLGDQDGSVSPTKTHDHVEGSVRLDSVFDHEIEHDSTKPDGQQTNGRRSHMIYNQDLMIEGINKNNIVKRSSQAMLDQICESEREMKELMARDMLMQDDLNGPIDNPNFDTNVRFSGVLGVRRLHEDNIPALHMNHTEYSQFIKNQDIKSSKQDFNGQFLINDQYSHMNLTMSQLKPAKTYSSSRPSHSSKAGFAFVKNFAQIRKDGRQFSPVNQQTIKLNVKRHKAFKDSKDKNSSATESSHIYPIQVHSKTNQIEKLRNQFLTTRTFQMQKSKNLNKMFLNSPPPNQAVRQSNHGSEFETVSKEQLQQWSGNNISMTRTRFSQHHRALSELRQIQYQIHNEQTEMSPAHALAKKGSSVSPTAKEQPVGKAAPFERSSLGKRMIDSPMKLQKKVRVREAKLESLRIKQETLHHPKALPKLSPPVDALPITLQEITERDSIVATNSLRNLSTCMDKHAPSLIEELQSALGSTTRGPAGQQVFVATSGSNSKFLATPAPPKNGNNSSPTQCMLVTKAPPFAIQQTKSFAGVLIEKSVLPTGRTYQNLGHNKGANKDIIDADLLSQLGEHKKFNEAERANSSIIANYQINSVEEEGGHSPKSYKMPANFMHGLESQNDSIGGGPTTNSIVGTPHMINRPDAVAINKSFRMPVHSFTTQQAHKTHSSQVNSRRQHIMANDKAAIPGQMENSIGLDMQWRKNAQNVQQIVTGSGACIFHEHEEVKSCEDQLPEQRYTHNDSESLQKMETNIMIENEMREDPEIQADDTMRNSMQQTEFEQMKLETRMNDEEDELGHISLSDRASAGITKPMNAVHPGANMLLSSAQTLEAEHHQTSDQPSYIKRK